MSISDLRKAETAYKAARLRAERARRRRNDLVRAALEAGAEPREVSEATGLTRGRISQIASRA